jgi:hypothetical protein
MTNDLSGLTLSEIGDRAAALGAEVVSLQTQVDALHMQVVEKMDELKALVGVLKTKPGAERFAAELDAMMAELSSQ